MRFLKNQSDAELPQHNRLRRDMHPADILKQASLVINCDPAIFTDPGRLPVDIKEKRDMLIFYLSKNVGMSNRQIGEVFGLTYSAVSKIGTSFRMRYGDDKDLMTRYEAYISNFKV